MAVVASAYVLFRMNTEAATKHVLDALLKSEGEKLEGVRQALCHGPIDRIVGPIHDILASAPPVVAVVAAEAFAFHSQLDPKGKRVAAFPADENPLVRKAAWRVVSLIDSPRAN